MLRDAQWRQGLEDRKRHLRLCRDARWLHVRDDEVRKVAEGVAVYGEQGAGDVGVEEKDGVLGG